MAGKDLVNRGIGTHFLGISYHLLIQYYSEARTVHLTSGFEVLSP